MPGFREAFDCPAFFDMVDRHMTEDIDFTPVIQECGLSQVPPLYYKSANSEYANRMWQVYRESYGCIYTGADGLFRKYNCAETLVSCRDIGSCPIIQTQERELMIPAILLMIYQKIGFKD
jgi:hypothetical protein